MGALAATATTIKGLGLPLFMEAWNLLVHLRRSLSASARFPSLRFLIRFSAVCLVLSSLSHSIGLVSFNRVY